METSVTGEVVCVRIPYHRSVKRFVQKRITRWLEHQADAARKLKDAIFYVKFERFGLGHDVFCSIQVVSGKERWRGTALANNLHKSLIFSLDHIVPSLGVV